MFHTNIKYAFRRLLKQPAFTSINGIGLTLGLMAFLYIMQYVAFQWSFNEDFPKATATYRLLDAPKGETLNPATPAGVAPRVKENIPGVELASRWMSGIGSGITLVERENSEPLTFRDDGIVFVDHDFLTMFERPILSGAPDLNKRNALVLTESIALKYFQTTQVTDKTIILINQFGEHPFQITGVIEDFPANADLQPTILGAMSTFESEDYLGYNSSWFDLNTLDNNFVQTYLTLSNPEVADNVVDYRRSLIAESNADGEMEIALQAVANMHLDSGEKGNLPTFGNTRLVWFLLILGILILLIAWINYVNLSTAQALKKAHALSVKKVIGAERGFLIRQQLAETFLLTATSVVVAIIGCFLIQPLFNQLVDLPLSLLTLLDVKFMFGAIAFLLLTSLTAGFYVAFVLTGFHPAKVLKGSFLRSKKGILVRKTLVTAQFGITIAFIAGTVIMLTQVRYLQNKDTGMTTERRLSFTGPGSYLDNWIETRDAFVEQVKQLSFVQQFTGNGGNPGRGWNMSVAFRKDRGQTDSELNNVMFIDEAFLEVFDINILAGTAPTAAMVRQGWWGNQKMIFNETAIEQMGFANPEAAIGEVVYFDMNGKTEEREILAVVEDYHQNSLHSTIGALALAPSLNQVWFTAEVAPATSSAQLAQLEAVYKQSFPKSPFIYHFVDEYYRSFYEDDQRLGQLVTIGALLAIFISCLGLLGLVAHSVEQRTKEIGVRKVLGASVSHIVGLISKDFIPLIGIAIFVAVPLAYYAMSRWLEDFAYRIEMQWWMFALAGVAAIGIAFLTVSLQSIKAALANPVNSLKNE
ncbi:MAG: FtsX-like permease family protein [Bacteroidota bacterium]